MGPVYYVYNKSISDLKIFNNNSEFLRIMDMLSYYQRENPPTRYSIFNELKKRKLHCVSVVGNANDKNEVVEEELVRIVAYCIMPTHIHLVLMESKENGISAFLNKLLISYTRYFNIKYKRKGTLWEGRTKKILVKTDDQLLHLTRYVHLNPVTAYLVNNPEDWIPSSYKEYISNTVAGKRICDYSNLINMAPLIYKKFVESGISYQREIAKLKNTDAV